MRKDVVVARGAHERSEAGNRDERPLEHRRIAGKLLLVIALLLIVAVATTPHAGAASGPDRTAGAEVFKQQGCAHCHGSDGAGTDRAPSLMTVGKRLKKNEIERQILDGGKQMPPFRDVLTEDQTRELVDYLAHKKKTPKPVKGG